MATRIVSFTDANLLATMGGLGMGIVLWFTSGGGYEESRAATYTCALTMVWGSVFYVIAYVASLYYGTQEQGNYQTKTWHLSEGAVFFVFLVFRSSRYHGMEKENPKTKRYKKLTIRLSNKRLML